MLIVAGPVVGDLHEGGPHHPERPARIGAVMAGIGDIGLGPDLVQVDAPLADLAALARVHDPAYLARLEAECANGRGGLDADTFVTADSWDAARRSAGAGLAAIEAIRAGNDAPAFVASRPPGHHASADQGMGFCLLNNIAVAAASLEATGERVLILDWDVHHGNGTQSIFWDDPNVLYASTHEWPLYPGTGRPHEVGGPHAPGLTINVPLPAGATGDVARRAFEELVVPAAEQFDPTWVLVSAGFDAHRADPLAGLCLSSGDFADLARLARSLAPRPGRLVLFLEGGYDLRALRGCTEATLSAVLGATSEPELPTHGGPGSDVIESYREIRDASVDRVQSMGRGGETAR